MTRNSLSTWFDDKTEEKFDYVSIYIDFLRDDKYWIWDDNDNNLKFIH